MSQPGNDARPRHLGRRTIRQLGRSVIVTGAMALLLAACTGAGVAPSGNASPTAPGGSTGSGGSPGGGSIEHPTGGHDLVIRYEEVGGFVAPEALVTRYPVVSIYGDGTTITLGPVTMIYPGQALPNLQARRISEAGLQKLLGLAKEAGLLGADATYDVTNIADATTARFTVVAGGATHVTAAYALGETSGEVHLDPSIAAARARLRAFAAAIGDLGGTLGADAAGADAPYQYDGIRIYASAGAPSPSDPNVARAPIAWPLSMPLATFGAPGTGLMSNARCGTVTGVDLETLRPLLANATQITGWTSAGKTYTLLLLPLLPDQMACPPPA